MKRNRCLGQCVRQFSIQSFYFAKWHKFQLSRMYALSAPWNILIHSESHQIVDPIEVKQLMRMTENYHRPLIVKYCEIIRCLYLIAKWATLFGKRLTIVSKNRNGFEVLWCDCFPTGRRKRIKYSINVITIQMPFMLEL